ncbi:MAG: tetratricopeptide repeat protein [Candidatus Omnitrophica bacterium]|nr:tetratricopeptide repeat protein [Candidatus Omnitrophota bacterium]
MKKIHFLAISLIIILVAISYANSLQNGFVWDDEFLVRDNSYIRSFSHVKDIFKNYLAYSSGNVNNFYRPVQDLSFMIDYFLWGYDPMGFHLTNVILHGLCAILLYILAVRLFKDNRVAFITGALFGVHPINTEAVTYVAGRADSLYLLFLLLAFICFLKAIKPLNGKKGIDPKFYVISLASYALSILSKEIGLIFPLFILVYHVSFIKDTPPDKKIRGLYLPYILIFGLYIMMRKTVLDFSAVSPSFLMAKFSLYERLLTSSKVIISYLRLLLLPFGLHMERTIKIARSLFEPDAALALFMVAAIVAAAFRAHKRQARKFSYALFLFFVGLLPVSNIVPINSFIAEHWLYLPAIGIFAIAAMGIVRLSDARMIFNSKIASKALALLITVGILSFYTHLTIERNRAWKDEVAFFKDTLRYVPNNARLHLNFGNTYFELGDIDKAIEEYKKASELNPKDPLPYGNMGSAYINLGKYKEGKEYIERALALNPNYPDALFNMGLIHEAMGSLEEAESFYKKGLALRPYFLPYHMGIASLYQRMGRIDMARRHWQEALKINPNADKARQMLGRY